MVGRKREQSILEMCLQSSRPEFLAVYGRRRVGKTYLIREFFHNRFAFYATGVAEGKTKDQLRAFHESLKTYGSTYEKQPKDWFEAFSRMRELIDNPHVKRDPVSGKRVVFLDEMPWMDTAKSDFRPALDYFWNNWGSAQTDLLLIACGSAASWMMKNS
ncbi:MAG: ATP-binding protein, partial [Clostridia bacterium]|nr:ATP-binding protein [Clostridia bacterium]